jgi:hypothetical protein
MDPITPLKVFYLDPMPRYTRMCSPSGEPLTEGNLRGVRLQQRGGEAADAVECIHAKETGGALRGADASVEPVTKRLGAAADRAART